MSIGSLLVEQDVLGAALGLAGDDGQLGEEHSFFFLAIGVTGKICLLLALLARLGAVAREVSVLVTVVTFHGRHVAFSGQRATTAVAARLVLLQDHLQERVQMHMRPSYHLLPDNTDTDTITDKNVKVKSSIPINAQ